MEASAVAPLHLEAADCMRREGSVTCHIRVSSAWGTGDLVLLPAGLGEADRSYGLPTHEDFHPRFDGEEVMVYDDPTPLEAITFDLRFGPRQGGQEMGWTLAIPAGGTVSCSGGSCHPVGVAEAAAPGPAAAWVLFLVAAAAGIGRHPGHQAVT